MIFSRQWIGLLFGVFISLPSWSAKLVIVIDDVGYHNNLENQILALPAGISISILPHAPHSKNIAEKAHKQNREILIHLPMLPDSSQPLEVDTLRTDMTQQQISHVIQQATKRVPYAKGMNNHMGSAMTANRDAMRLVMNELKKNDLYFLDSMTTAKSQGYRLAKEMGIPTLQRTVFLDNALDEKSIRQQMQRAIDLARKKGVAVVIGHPHPSTIKVLSEAMVTLPEDIQLVPPSQIIHTDSTNAKNEIKTELINADANSNVSVWQVFDKKKQTKLKEADPEPTRHEDNLTSNVEQDVPQLPEMQEDDRVGYNILSLTSPSMQLYLYPMLSPINKKELVES